MLIAKTHRPVENVDAGSSEDEQIYTRLTRSGSKRRKLLQSRKGRQGVARESTKSPASRKSKSKLAALSEFPLDIMYEIFSHLQPAQLLCVSRTNKTLRGALMRKSARWIWRASFQNDEDIPPVPTDLNERQYARLLFDNSCMYCPSRFGTHVAWAARVRCCGKCLEDQFMEHDDLANNHNTREIVENCVPIYKHKDRGIMYVTDQVISFIGECNSTWEGARGDDESMCTWLYERRRQCDLRIEHSKQLEMMVKVHLARQRREAIYQKLCESGWGEQLQDPEADLRHHKLVYRPRRLTQRGWKNIEHELNAYCKKALIRRRYKSLADAYDEYLSAQSRDTLFPPIGSLVSLEHIRTEIENTKIDKQDLSRDVYLRLLHDVPPSFFIEWRAQADAALVETMEAARPGQAGITTDHLSLACTLFLQIPQYSLDGLGAMKTYPDLLADTSVTDRYAKVFSAVRERTLFAPWSTGRLSAIDDRLSGIARGLLTSVGLDPDTATHDDVDLRDPWFFAEDDGELQALRWPVVVAHATGMKPGDRIFVVAEEEAARCRWDYANLTWISTHLPDMTVARCVSCSATFKSDDVDDHFRSVHGKDVVTFRDIVPRRGSGICTNGFKIPRREFVHEAIFTIPDALPVPEMEL